MAEYGEWNRKGAILSDVTAQKEYGVTRDFIVEGIVDPCNIAACVLWARQRLASERDLHLRVLIALLRQVEGGGCLLGWHGGGEQRFYVNQPTIEAGDGMGEFAVEAKGAAEIYLLGHDKIAGNRELAGRKGAHLDDGCAWSHGLEAGREPGRISGYLERDLEAGGALDFLFERAAALADIDRHIRTDLPGQGKRFVEDIGNADGLGPGSAGGQQDE